MTIHEEHQAPMMKKGWEKMKTIDVKCDFCDRPVDDGTFFEMRTCNQALALDICPRCMAILEDEVRKKVNDKTQTDTVCHRCGKPLPWNEGRIIDYDSKLAYCSMQCLEEGEKEDQ